MSAKTEKSRHNRIVLGVIAVGMILTFIYLYDYVQAQSEFDYYILTGVNGCGSALTTVDHIRSVTPGEENHVVGVYDYGTSHDLLDDDVAAGNEFKVALKRILVCPRNNLDDYWVNAALSGGGDGGYVVSYELYVRRELGTSFLLHVEDSIGGVESGCLDIDGYETGNFEAVWQGSYFYGMQLSAEGATNSTYCATDGYCYARLQFSVHLSESPTETPTSTPTETLTPSSTPTETPDATMTPTQTPVWYEECEFVMCEENEFCGPQGKCYFISPLDTPTPPPTPTPQAEPVRMRILSDVGECDGVELLPVGVQITPGSIWETTQSWPIDIPFNARFTFFTMDGDSASARASVNGVFHEFVVQSSAGADYYELTLPFWSTLTAGYVNVVGENTDVSDNLYLYSVCIQRAEYEDCINPDPGLNSGYDFWVTSGSSDNDIENGIARIFENDIPGMLQQYDSDRAPGLYSVDVDASSFIGNDTIDMVVEAGNLEEHVAVGGTITRYSFQFNDSGERNMQVKFNSSGMPGNQLRIYRVCVKQIQTSTPTPSPTPTPTPIPPETYPGDPSGCDNPDPGFNIPGVWSLVGARIDEGILSLMSYATEANESVNMPYGTYNLSFSARALDAPMTCVSKRLDIGFYGEMRDGSFTPQITKYVTLVDDGQWHDYNLSVNLTDPNPAMGQFDAIHMTLRASCMTESMQRAGVPDVRATWIQVAYVCVSDGVGDGTPTPTISPSPTTPPGMTATPTPTGPVPPTGCSNYDPGIDGTEHWSALSGATIANSVASMPPGGKLLSEITQDAARQYYVYVVGKCNSPSGAVISWRNDARTWACSSSAYEEYVFLFSNVIAPTTLAKPLSEMLEDNWQPQVLFSPLDGPDVSPQWNARLSSNIFQVSALNGNAGVLDIQSICITDAGWAPDPEPDIEDLDLYHPVCERDYSIQRGFQDNLFWHFYGMLIGPGKRPGMPVHAIGGGIIVGYGESLSYVLGDDPTQTTYSGCILINHSSVYNANIQSVYCNIGEFSIPSSLQVERGALLGYTSDYAGDNGLRGDGLAVVAVQTEGTWVNPRDFFVSYPDCRPYAVVITPVETCDADDGSGTIPPRFNPETPAFWEVGEWVPWLAQRLYDVLGYPILCGIMPMINAVIDIIVGFANAVIQAVSPPLIFIYRVGRIFEYMLYVLDRVLDEINALFDAVNYVSVCVRTIIVYFVSAIRSASDATITVNMPEKGNVLTFGFTMAMVLISSTVANVLLTPIVGLFCGYAAWKLVPWGIKTLRKGFGFGQ